MDSTVRLVNQLTTDKSGTSHAPSVIGLIAVQFRGKAGDLTSEVTMMIMMMMIVASAPTDAEGVGVMIVGCEPTDAGRRRGKFVAKFVLQAYDTGWLRCALRVADSVDMKIGVWRTMVQ